MRGTLGPANLGLFAVFTLIASGCASLRPYDPGPGRRVATGFVQDTYLSGESVNITIANLSDVTLFYPDAFCKTQLQRKSGNAWLKVADQPAACPSSLGFLEPGQTVVHPFRLPQGIAVGTYRFIMPMPIPDDEDTRESDLFTPAFQVASSSSH
ncbi:MAG: hypothetical protein DMD63_06615 [Gemmatimonadetes bacterium]|nr:MAG: hypothetical protein DMD63_06615 [Gemmatimonadota bacterium]